MKGERYGRGGFHFGEDLRRLAASCLFAAFFHFRRGTAPLVSVR